MFFIRMKFVLRIGTVNENFNPIILSQYEQPTGKIWPKMR